jgi:hypothetical protein
MAYPCMLPSVARGEENRGREGQKCYSEILDVPQFGTAMEGRSPASYVPEQTRPDMKSAWIGQMKTIGGAG